MKHEITNREELLLKKLHCYEIALRELSCKVDEVSKFYKENHKRKCESFMDRLSDLRVSICLFRNGTDKVAIEYGVSYLIVKAQERLTAYQKDIGTFVEGEEEYLREWKEVVRGLEEAKDE
jgi:hypothetical protein